MPTEIDEDALAERDTVQRALEITRFWNAVQRLRDEQTATMSIAAAKARRKALGEDEP